MVQGTEGPDENGLDRINKVSPIIWSDGIPPSIGNGQGFSQNRLDRQGSTANSRRQGLRQLMKETLRGSKTGWNNAARQQKQKIAGKRMPAPARNRPPKEPRHPGTGRLPTPPRIRGSPSPETHAASAGDHRSCWRE